LQRITVLKRRNSAHNYRADVLNFTTLRHVLALPLQDGDCNCCE